jgi:hypothetical protein
MQDLLGLDPKRKGNVIEESFGRYSPLDYSGVLEEVQKQRQDASGKLRLSSI